MDGQTDRILIARLRFLHSMQHGKNGNVKQSKIMLMISRVKIEKLITVLAQKRNSKIIVTELCGLGNQLSVVVPLMQLVRSIGDRR